MEGKKQVRASEVDGITESWIQFETGVARGFGHPRLKEGRIWTLLTTMSELGHEEPVGFDRPMGAKHGAERNRKTWKEEREAAECVFGLYIDFDHGFVTTRKRGSSFFAEWAVLERTLVTQIGWIGSTMSPSTLAWPITPCLGQTATF